MLRDVWWNVFYELKKRGVLMQFLRVCLCVLMSFAVQAEIPFQQMKGLSLQDKTTGNESIFSPIYGFLALKTGTLERIRFFGNYSKIYKTHKGKEGLIVTPAELIAPDLSHVKDWMHLAFSIRDIEKLRGKMSEAELNVEIARNFDRQFEYPQDAISALIQWLFPSVDGANFVVNDYRNDPVGEMTLWMQDQAKVEKLKGLPKTDPDHEKLGNDIAKIKEKRGDFGSNPFTPILQKVYEFYGKSLDINSLNTKKNTIKPEVFAQEFEKSFKKEIKGILDNAWKKDHKSKKHNRQAFTDILYAALVQDGTFKQPKLK